MRIRHAKKTWTVYLVDDGTLDTVISINGREARFDSEYASQYRRKDGSMSERGLRALAVEAINDDPDF